MKQSLQIGREPNFQIIVIASALLHLVFIAFAAVPFKTKDAEFKSYFVTLEGPMESPVEVRGEAKSPKGSAVSPVEPAKPEAGILPESEKSKKERVSREIERLRALSSLSKEKKGRMAEKSRGIEVIRQRIQEDAGTGVKGGSQSTDFDTYYSAIIRKIKSGWIYPEFDSAGLEALVSFRMDGEGKVVAYKVEKSSGSTLFDRSAVNAILKASPLPPHPVENEIVVRFRP
ncbi:MAG: cell envelope integrity protein TolA [Nitrospiraceae bacterium]|nr:MAG: cell envelope integrity protein TolA [Nitrospiraceae bacterium]